LGGGFGGGGKKRVGKEVPWKHKINPVGGWVMPRFEKPKKREKKRVAWVK